MQRVGISQNKLALCARINQSYLNRLYNRRIKNVSTDTLVSICLALGLNEEEAEDLMSRIERVLSPSNPLHSVYRELIRIYSKMEIDYKVCNVRLSAILDFADSYLKERGYTGALPNCNL